MAPHTLNDPSSPSPPAAAGTLQLLEHGVEAVEAAVEEVIDAAERSLAQRIGARIAHTVRATLRVAFIATVIAYFIFGATWLATRYWLMPRIDTYRPWLETEISRLLATPVRIAHIETGWRGFFPHLRLSQVELMDRDGRAALSLPHLEATLSWTSVPAMQVRFRDLWILTPELDIERLPDGRFLIAGLLIDPTASKGQHGLADWALSQPHIGIRNARIRYIDRAARADAAPPAENTTLAFEEVDFDFHRGVLRNGFAFRARPPAALGSVIDVRGEYRRPWLEPAADVSQWSGRAFVQLDYADVARVAELARALPVAMAIERAQGALRAWLEFDAGRIVGVTADLALVDVVARLGADLPPLQVEQLQGRVTEREWGTAWEGGHEVSLSRFSVSGVGVNLPPTDVRLRYTRATETGVAAGRPERGLLEASGVQLEAMSTLAKHLPVAPAWREAAKRYGIRGQVSNVKYSWEGAADAPSDYSLRARFDGLAVQAQAADPPLNADGKPRPGVPGFENLAGTVEFDRRGGVATLRAQNAALEFPGVFEEPRLNFEALTSNVRWTRREQLEVRVQALSATNTDFELNAQATYRSGGTGPGFIDANGSITRAQASAVHKYVPLAASEKLRTWLRGALLAGEARGGSFRLKGDLADFPFAAPESGEFRIDARFAGGTLDFAPPRPVTTNMADATDSQDAAANARPSAWPPLTGIEGDLVLDRRKLEITARRAQVFGVRIGATRARIAELGAPDVRLLIDGSAVGPLADMLRYVNASPVGGWLGGALARSSTTGNGTLDLKLDIPLKHVRDTQVRGTVALANNDIALRDDWTPFTRVNGQLVFTESTLRMTDVDASFAGGPFRLSANTRPEGAIEFAASGTATPQGVRRLTDIVALQRLLDSAQGAARYSATVVVKGRRPEVRIESDLAGWSIDGPDPLRKAAADNVPLKVEIAPTGSDSDTIRVSAGARLALRLDRGVDKSGRGRVERGAVVLGEANVDTLALPARGVRATINVARLDIDRWKPFFDGQSADGGGVAGADVALNVIAARVDELVIGGKAFAHVVVGATRDDDGLWLANVVSDHVTGSVTWSPPQAAGLGRVSARLARLVIPEQQRAQITELLEAPPTELPAVDIVANEFELGSRKLGRLELVAQNVGAGAAAAWQLQRLEIANPEGRMSASGQWLRDSGVERRRMSMNLALHFSDAGRLLGRLGIADVVRGGEGKLEGEINWRGSPLAIDYPSLAGTLKLTTAKGQFLKADAGAGRLLGVLSLQSLPRRITLDFRDVFSDGFAFDTIAATADVSSGVLSTRDFKMRGVNATVLIEGSADLKRETQNLHVLVLPEVNAGSASLVYALLANPAIGLGTFLAQLFLRDPLSKALSYEYDVTGSWTEPQVKRRETAVTTAAESTDSTQK